MTINGNKTWVGIILVAIAVGISTIGSIAGHPLVPDAALKMLAEWGGIIAGVGAAHKLVKLRGAISEAAEVYRHALAAIADLREVATRQDAPIAPPPLTQDAYEVTAAAPTDTTGGGS